MLVKRLATVLHKVIGESQNVFVLGRQITDAILIANEVVDEAIKNNQKGALCKLDMEKAFDHDNWDFIDNMLERLGFGTKMERLD